MHVNAHYNMYLITYLILHRFVTKSKFTTISDHSYFLPVAPGLPSIAIRPILDHRNESVFLRVFWTSKALAFVPPFLGGSEKVSCLTDTTNIQKQKRRTTPSPFSSAYSITSPGWHVRTVSNYRSIFSTISYNL